MPQRPFVSVVKENGYTLVCLYCIFQLPIAYPSAEEDLASQEDNVPVAMTTRLRRQSERERERELRELRIRKTADNIDLLPPAQSDPSVWTVEDVWAFIRSLPGMQLTLIVTFLEMFVEGEEGTCEN